MLLAGNKNDASIESYRERPILQQQVKSSAIVSNFGVLLKEGPAAHTPRHTSRPAARLPALEFWSAVFYGECSDLCCKMEGEWKCQLEVPRKCQASDPILASKTLFYPKISVLKGKTPEKALFSLKSLRPRLLTCFRRFCTVWLKSALLRVDAIFISSAKLVTRFWPQKRCFTRKYQFSMGKHQKKLFSV